MKESNTSYKFCVLTAIGILLLYFFVETYLNTGFLAVGIISLIILKYNASMNYKGFKLMYDDYAHRLPILDKDYNLLIKNYKDIIDIQKNVLDERRNNQSLAEERLSSRYNEEINNLNHKITSLEEQLKKKGRCTIL